MTWLIAAGGLGGVLVLLTAIVVIGRGIFRQVNAVEENTDAVKNLTAEVTNLKTVYNNHETRISILEDRVKR